MKETKFTHQITVGFPVYNVEDYVYNSLLSVLNQDFDSYEVVVVDDCGSDKSMDIIRNLISTHPSGRKVRIIKHSQNKGLAEARNTTIKNAMSKYIFFLDSDDYLSSNALSILYKAAEKNKTDIVIGSNYKTDGKRIWSDNDDVFPYTLFENGEFAEYYYGNISDIMPATVWNILFNMEFLKKNNLLFPSIRFQEDIAFDELYYPCIQRALLIPNKTYYYMIRANSLMNHQSRDLIDISEAKRAIDICKLLKSYCTLRKNNSFYGGLCAKTLKICFYEVTGIIKHRHRFNGDISDRAIKNMIKHPESFISILKFKQLKKYNFFYFFLGILPPKICVIIIRFICMRKRYNIIHNRN